jgi:hypothetical protein
MDEIDKIRYDEFIKLEFVPPWPLCYEWSAFYIFHFGDALLLTATVYSVVKNHRKLLFLSASYTLFMAKHFYSKIYTLLNQTFIKLKLPKLPYF